MVPRPSLPRSVKGPHRLLWGALEVRTCEHANIDLAPVCPALGLAGTLVDAQRRWWHCRPLKLRQMLNKDIMVHHRHTLRLSR